MPAYWTSTVTVSAIHGNSTGIAIGVARTRTSEPHEQCPREDWQPSLAACSGALEGIQRKVIARS
jgi:hypothetical protein